MKGVEEATGTDRCVVKEEERLIRKKKRQEKR